MIKIDLMKFFINIYGLLLILFVIGFLSICVDSLFFNEERRTKDFEKEYASGVRLYTNEWNENTLNENPSSLATGVEVLDYSKGYIKYVGMDSVAVYKTPKEFKGMYRPAILLGGKLHHLNIKDK